MRHSNTRTFPTLAVFVDSKGRIHTPPPPPLVNNYAPWEPQPNEHRRDAPLSKCPVLACRRAHACRAPFLGTWCRKTHLRTEECRASLAVKLGKLLKAHIKAQGLSPLPPEDGGMRGLKLALEQRVMDDKHKALQAWQESWVKEMQEKERKQRSAAK